MPRRLRSWFQTRSKRHGNAEGREGSKDQEQSRPALLPGLPTFTQLISATTSTFLPASLLTALATSSTDRETSAGADDTTTSLPVRLWERAYNELKQEEVRLVDAYEKILSRQLQDGPGSTVPESQPNTIAQNTLDRRRQMTQLINAGLAKTEREVKVKESLGVAVDAVLSAKNTISAAIQAVPQAALAWTGICIALEMLANPIKATEANRKGINYVVKRMDWYWNLSTSLLRDPINNINELSGMRGELENQIVDLYKALLSYQIKSVCAYYRNRALVFLQDMITLDDWKADLGAIQDAEKCFRDDTQTYTAQQVTSRLEQLVIQQMSEKDQQCLKHLYLTNPRHDKTRIEQTKGGLLQDSYLWILDNADFQRWRNDLQHRLLWIKGDPGKGKTMLLCGIIDQLNLRNATNADYYNVAYFFCQATDSRINNATAVLRGLIYLLIEQQPSLLSHVQNLRTTYLIIDALDECVDWSKLLDLIPQQSSSGSRVKWIVSSRNWPQIEERLEKAADKVKVSLELNAESVAAAVNAFILHKVDDLAGLKKYDPRTKKIVQDYLCSNAQDTFLWVALVCQVLAGPEVKKWRTEEMLREFPSGLDALYARMRENMSRSEDSDLYKRILAVAAIVRRPINLQELATLVEVPDVICDDLESLKEIIGLCGSFLTLREQTVYFVHQSAKDFLLGNASDKAGNQASQEAFKWIFPSGKEDVNYTIFSRSLDAMSTTLRRDIYGLRAPGFPSDKVQVPDPDPLATVRYSCVYWVNHLCDLVSSTNTNRNNLLQDNGVVYTFLKTKYLYWLEALSLLQAMSEGVIAIRQLEGLLTLEGHSHSVSSVAFSPDGQRLASGSADNTIKIWDPASGSCLQTLEGYSNPVLSVAFSPDGQRLASCSEHHTIKIWDPASGSCLQTLTGHSWADGSVAFSPDGQRLASGTGDCRIKIWNLVLGSCLQTLEGYSRAVDSVAFSPDGQRLASGSVDKTIKIWDLVSGSCLQTIIT
ncbi:hypothetical protein QBC32DRAFT_321280, partial [Pseudoneurospora amorphoporcata]